MKKGLFVLIAAAFISFHCAYSQVYKTVHVDTAGKLNFLLTPEERGTVTDLTLTGEINIDDYNTMKSLPALRVIDLAEVQTAGDSIPGFAFRGDVLSVILPSSITRLGIQAFTSCSSLTTLTIPYGVTSIPFLAFAGCSSLTSLILPETVISIGKQAFAGCSRLPFIDLPDSVTSIGEQAFVACDSMSFIVIPPKVTELVPNAFAGSSWLDSISIGSSVTSIGMYAFAGCNNLKSITIPASVDSIATFAFVGCPGLTSVIIKSSSETYVGEYAFAGDANLTSVTIFPSDGILLGKYAFVSCTSLKNLNMATWSVTSIGEGCFINTAIDTLIFPSSLDSIAKYAFINNDSLRSVTFLPSSGTSISEFAFQDCSNLASVIMNSPSVDSIGRYCFVQCINLTHVIMPSSMVYIGDYAFRDCRVTGTLTMPSSLEHVGEYAFFRQPIDTLIFLPSSGTYLGVFSFAYNPDLTRIIMYSPSVDTLDDRCFSDCENLKHVVLPSSLSSIQYGAFGWDNNLEWFRINSLIPPVFPEGTNVFPYWTGGSIDLYVPAGTKEAYQAAVFWSRFNIIEYDLNLTANPDTLIIVDTASTFSFDITSSVNWQVSPDQQWLIANPVIGLDTAVITLTAEANPDTVIREALVTLSGVNVPLKTVVVIQDPKPALSVSDHIMDIGWQEGSMAYFTINSNQEWTVQSGQTWLEVSQLSGSRSHEIILTAVANPDTLTREAYITVSTGRLSPHIIRVTQLPKMYLTVAPSEMRIGSDEGSTAQFSVLTNALWTVLCDQSWLTVNFASGLGNIEIVLTAVSNPEFVVRDALITVSVDGLPAQIISVTQEAAIPTGINDVSREEIGVYPNPVKNVLHIDHAAGREIIVLDTWGRILLSQKLKDDQETLDLTFLAPGEYLIKIGERMIKVVK